MTKILFFITSLGGGGAERVLVDLVNHLDRDKFDITVQTLIPCGSRIDELKNDITYKSIIKTKNKLLRNFFSILITKVIPAKFVYNLFIKNNYDTEVAFLEGLPTKIISFSTNATSKKFAWIHTDLVKYFDSSKVFKSANDYRRAYEKFDKIVGVSKDVADRFKERFNWKQENVYVEYNINDESKIVSLSEEYSPFEETDCIKVITCGRLQKQKGYDRLLRIHKRLIDERLYHKLYILGEGSERENLEKFIRENHLENTVSLLGFSRNPYPYFQGADLFVCSSIAEGYSTVVTEACILGLPVITTKVAGACEPVDGVRYSILCENNEEALYAAMKSVLEEPQKLEKYKEDMRKKSEYFKMENQIKIIEDFLLS